MASQQQQRPELTSSPTAINHSHSHHQSRPPPSYTAASTHHQHHDAAALQLPSVPRDELPHHAPITLPDLKSLGLPDTHKLGFAADVNMVGTGNNAAANGYAANQKQWLPFQFPRVPETDPDALSPSLSESVVSVGSVNGTAGVSVDDPDVRMAAEALSGLGKLDFMRSPSVHSTTLRSQRSSVDHTNTAQSIRPRSQQPQEPEPLLRLLTYSHPWVGGTINGSLSAYNATKHYSPRFVRSSAEFVERTIGSPVANTVGSVSRRTGVEGSIRRYLGGRRRSDMEDEEGGYKKRRIMGIAGDVDEMDIEKGMTPSTLTPRATSPPTSHRSRAQSQASFTESLPAYDENRSPQYVERDQAVNHSTTEAPQGDDASQQQGMTSRSHAWGTQLMITTSGLGAALSESSLRSLRYCLQILHTSTARVGNIMRALKLLLEDYERSTQNHDRTTNSVHDSAMDSSWNHEKQRNSTREQQARHLANAIKAHSTEIWDTLRAVINNISHYTGGALPENASALVRRQLMSVPQRWRAASAATSSISGNGTEGSNASSTGGEAGEAVASAHRMLAFAKEGLDMMAQVALVLEGTVVSAEQWLASMGRGSGAEQSFGENSSTDEKRGLGLDSGVQDDGRSGAMDWKPLPVNGEAREGKKGPSGAEGKDMIK